MAARAVRIGVIAYRREDMDHIGAWGFHGEKVDVHEDDVERFDSLNGEPAEAMPPAAPVVEDGQPDGQPDAEALDGTVAPKGGASLADGVVPRRLVASSSHFHRCAALLEPAGGVRIHVAGVDLVRDAAGAFRVLEDNLRTPSGISYVIENRRAMTHVFPELFASHRIRRVADYPLRLLEAFRATAPPGVDDPCVVVLTPGIHNSAYFEHSFLAQQMGVELVEGRDLVCRDQRVDMRTTGGEPRVGGV